MGSLEIICHNCGAIYEVTPDTIIDADKLQPGVFPYRCPHCLASMNKRTWNKLVDAFWTFEEANKELREWHTGYDNHPLLQAQIKTYYVPRGKILI